MVDPEGFLFIEPKKPPTAEPIIDELTRQVTAAYRAGTLDSHGGYRGFHVCSCLAISDNRDHYLPTGKITNSLCIHYIAFHRHELTREEKAAVLIELAACKTGEAEPTADELQWPVRKH